LSIRALPGTRYLEAAGPVREQKIAGRIFFEADGHTLRGIPQGFQANLAIVERDFVLSLIFEADTREKLDRLLDSVNSLRFWRDFPAPGEQVILSQYRQYHSNPQLTWLLGARPDYGARPTDASS
jgi:hypothetical protein